MLQIIETEITIPGLKKELELLHITDLHLTYADGRDNAYVQELSRERGDGFPNAHDMLGQLKAYLKENPPDYTVLTGDIIDFPSIKNLEALENFLKNDCKNYLYTLGNHDWCYPIEQPTAQLLRQRCKKFMHITGGTPDFQMIDAGGVLLIGLDDTRYRFTRLQLEKLKEAFAKDIPCLLFFHIPLYAETLTEDVMKVWRQPIMTGTPESAFNGNVNPELLPDAVTLQVYNLIGKKESPMRGVISGHVHFAHEDAFGENKMQYITCDANAKGPKDVCIRRIRLVPGL